MASTVDIESSEIIKKRISDKRSKKITYQTDKEQKEDNFFDKLYHSIFGERKSFRLYMDENEINSYFKTVRKKTVLNKINEDE